MNAIRRAAVLDVDKIDQGALAHYRYTLTTSSAQADLPMALRVDVPLRSQVVAAVCRALQSDAEAKPDHGRRLRQHGEMLYRLLFPGHSQPARLMAARLADWADPLVISTNDVEVPWELVHDGAEFLGVRLPLGRRVVTSEVFQEGRPVGPVGETRRALIVANPQRDLDAADDEAEGLTRFLTDHGIQCTVLGRGKADLVGVLKELTVGNYDIFHYSGHVDTDESGQAGIRLHDEYLSVGEIRAVCSASNEGLTAAPPVVFLNGCRSAEHLSSVCGAFLDTGSRIVVGARYRIIDSVAREFAESWYTGLLAGMTAGEALQDARRSHRHGVTGTWASFVLFGQPATQLWEPPAKAAEPVPVVEPAPEEKPATSRERFGDPVWDEIAEHLDAGARQVLGRIIESAREFGVVTSLHVAGGLVDVDSALGSAVIAAGFEPRRLVEILVAPPDSPSPAAGGVPKPSENAEAIFRRAVQLAQADGGRLARVEDLASAFVDTGGGFAGEVLSHLGVDLGISGSLFGDSGTFRAHYLGLETQRAVYCAKLLADVKGEVISSESLLLGFAMSRSPLLREALLDQGTAGEAAVRVLFPEASQLTLKEFSRRASLSFERALETGRETGSGPIGDALVLRELLSDPTSAACALLTGLGLDLDRLHSSLAGRNAPGEDEALP